MNEMVNLGHQNQLRAITVQTRNYFFLHAHYESLKEAFSRI
jgi:hypothetical protein